jgi:hypothetical protein
MIRKALLRKSRVFSILLILFAFLSNNFAIAATPIALNVQTGVQASPYSFPYTGTLSASLTTTSANTILVAYISWEGGANGGSNSTLTNFYDGGSTNLTWTKRVGYYNTATQSQEIWWAYAPNIGTYTGTASWTNTNVDDSAINLMAFSGVDQSSPWDSNSATTLPAGTLSGTFSTVKSNTYLLGFYANDMPAPPATPIPSGTVNQISAVTNGGARWYQYSYVIGGAVATVQNNINLGWTSVNSYLSSSYVILDALKAAGQNTPININSVAQANKNQTSNITFNLPSSPGKVSVYANNRPVARCFNISVGAVSSFTCAWKPAFSGPVKIYATFQETGSAVISSRTSDLNLIVNKRSGAR